MGCRCVPSVVITLYREPASAEGQSAREYFERKGMRYDDVDTVADPVARQQMLALSGQTDRPVIVVGGEVVVGYDPEVLDPIIPSRF